MLKKTLLLLFIFFTHSLLANDLLDNFIDEQIKVEAQFLDQNLSLDKKVAIKNKQEISYGKFFLYYAADKEKNLQVADPYRTQITRLKLRLNDNKYRGNSNAVMRDEVLMQGYDVRNMIRSILHDTLMATNGESKAFFKEKVNDILIKYLSKYKPLDRKKYLFSDQNQSSPIVKSLIEAVQKQSYLESVVNTFSSELVQESTHIYKTARISESRLFSILNTINTSPYGLKVNTYLAPLRMDVAQVLLVLLIILFLLIVQIILRFVIDRILHRFKFKEEDIDYINSHITKLFNLVISVMIIQVILVSILGLDAQGINLSKLFAIFYVVAIALILYRINNTVAYMKMEQFKKSKIIKNEVMNLIIKVINGLIGILAAIFILQILGVNLTALLSGLGIAGAAVAFAAKDSIANIFGSISILLGDVFEQGDWIEAKEVDGTVVEIGLRASTIRTFDNALISIPNSELANNGVKNWSRRRIGRRIKMNIGVTYQSDFSDIRQAVLDIREMLKDHSGIANQHTEYHDTYRQSRLVSTEDFKGIKRTTLVFMDEFADSSINILVYCFSRTVIWEEWLEVKEDVMFKLAEILAKNNLDFAYPSLTIHQGEQETVPEIKTV
jgi:MscS family membrane protein